MRRWRAGAWLASALLALALFISAAGFFYFRDNFSTHFPVKSLSARILRGGSLPYWNSHVGGGQPLGGNPNLLTFYPDTLLYLILPPHVAFNLHFLLHAIVAFLAMRALLKELDVSDQSARFAATVYLASGLCASSFAFYNLITAFALIPLSFLAIERLASRPDTRNTIMLGTCFGLVGLAGEPVTVIGLGISAIILTARRLSVALVWRAAFAVMIAIFIAAPQLIAYAEIAREVERAAQPFSTQTVLAASLSPERLLEMVVGPFRGLATDLGSGGWRANTPQAKWPPFFLSLLLGAILIPSLIDRTIARYQWLVALLTAVGLGQFNPLVRAMVEQMPSIRIARYPEKLVIPVIVGLVVLIGLWMDRPILSKRSRIGSAVGIGIILIGAVLLLGQIGTAARLRLIIGSLIAIAVLTIVSSSTTMERIRKPLMILTLLPLAAWFLRTIPIDRAIHYTRPSRFLSDMSAGGRLWRPVNEAIALPEKHAKTQYRIGAVALDPIFGVAHGGRYGLDRSADGLYSTLSRIAAERVTSVPLPVAIRYLRIAGCDTVVTRSTLKDPQLVHLRTVAIAGNRLNIYRVRNARPRVAIAGQIIKVGSIQEAVQTIEGPDFDVNRTAVVPRREGIRAGKATIGEFTSYSQSIDFLVEATEDSVIIINESYFHNWSVQTGGKRLATFPANLDRLGVIIPRGRWLVRASFGRYRHLVGLTWFLSLVFLGVVALSTARSRILKATPAR